MDFYLGDPFHRQLQLFCYCACPDLPKWRKICPIFEIRCHSSNPYSLKNIVGSNDVYINWMDCTMLKKKIVPIPDSKIQLFWLLFPTLVLFLAPYHDFHRSLSLSWRSIQSPITTFLLLRMRESSKMAEIRPHFLRSVAIPSVHPVYICIVRWLVIKKILSCWLPTLFFEKYKTFCGFKKKNSLKLFFR